MACRHQVYHCCSALVDSVHIITKCIILLKFGTYRDTKKILSPLIGQKFKMANGKQPSDWTIIQNGGWACDWTRSQDGRRKSSHLIGQ